MSAAQGIKVEFGPTGSTYFQSSSWPYPTPNDDNKTIKQVIAVADGDTLVLHLNLTNFDWGKADRLLVLISRNHDEVPSAFFVNREVQGQETNTYTVASFDHLLKDGEIFGKTRFHFSKVPDHPESVTQPGFVFREYKRFVVKVYRLQAAVGTQGRRPNELFGSIRFGSPNDDVSVPPKRQDASIGNIHLNRRLVHTEGPVANSRYHVPVEKNWPLTYVIYYRSKNWFQAFQGQRVEESYLGLVPFSNGLFSQPGARVTYRDGRSFINSGVAHGSSLEASVGLNRASGMRRPRQISPGNQSVIDVTPDSPAKRRRTENATNGTVESPAGANPNVPIILDGHGPSEASALVTGSEIEPDAIAPNASNAQSSRHGNQSEATNFEDTDEDLYGAEDLDNNAVNLLSTRGSSARRCCTGDDAEVNLLSSRGTSARRLRTGDDGEVNLLSSQGASSRHLCTGNDAEASLPNSRDVSPRRLCTGQDPESRLSATAHLTQQRGRNNATATNNDGAPQISPTANHLYNQPTQPIVEQNLYGGLPHHQNHTGQPGDIEVLSDDEEHADDIDDGNNVDGEPMDIDNTGVSLPLVLPDHNEALVPAETARVSDTFGTHSNGSETAVDPEDQSEDTTHSVTVMGRLVEDLTNLRMARGAFSVLHQTSELAAIGERMRAMEGRLTAALVQMSENILTRSEADIQQVVASTAPHDQGQNNNVGPNEPAPEDHNANKGN